MTPNVDCYQRRFVLICFSPYIKNTTVTHTMVDPNFILSYLFRKLDISQALMASALDTLMQAVLPFHCQRQYQFVRHPESFLLTRIYFLL